MLDQCWWRGVACAEENQKCVSCLKTEEDICSLLDWISYPHFDFKGLLLLRTEKNFPWSLFYWFFFFFIRTAAIRQRKLFQDTSESPVLGTQPGPSTAHLNIAQLLRDQEVFFSMISPNLVSISVWETCLVLLVFERKGQEATELLFWLWNVRLWLSTSRSEMPASQERCHVQTPARGIITYRALILNVKDR